MYKWRMGFAFGVAWHFNITLNSLEFALGSEHHSQSESAGKEPLQLTTTTIFFPFYFLAWDCSHFRSNCFL